MAFHAATQQFVRFGGSARPTFAPRATDETWVWSGSGWSPPAILTIPGPPPRTRHSLTAFDAIGELVLFGGVDADGVDCAETWGWNGVFWWRHLPATSPPARSRHGAACDPRRGRLVLYGGEAGGVGLSDTWEYDGVTWSQHVPPSSPPPGRSEAMAYDPATQRVMLLQQQPTVWEWDGAAWTGIAPQGHRVSGLMGQQLVTDVLGNGVLVVGGDDLGSALSTRVFARWDGTTWTDLTGTVGGLARRDHTTAVDPGSGTVLTFGGSQRYDPFESLHAETYTWNLAGGSWLLVDDQAPSTRYGASIDALPDGSLVVVGGWFGVFSSDQAWRHDGTGWQQLPNLPNSTGQHGAAFDSARSRLVIFGGCGGFISPSGSCTANSDTYEFDGNAWVLAATGGPSPRTHCAMAYDPVRQRTVLFGGYDPGFGIPVPVTDTWEWDGTVWLQRSPTTVPPVHGPMTFVPALGALVMNASGALWTFDGVDWAPWITAPGPGEIVWDQGRDRLVLMTQFDVHEYDGTAWLLRSNRQFDGLATWHDGVRRVVAFQDGGLSYYGAIAPGSSEPLGLGCAGSAGLIELRPDNDPYLDGAWRLRLMATSAATPPGLRLVAVGLPSASWSGQPLPIDLASFGMPGCRQHVAVDAVFSTPTDDWALPIPNVLAFAGIQVDVQALVPDPTANAAGLIVTNARRATIGIR
ncbi:MAG: kelch repeat-containing protein [Planctomycetota bacterium]